MGKRKNKGEFEEFDAVVLYGSLNVRTDPFVEDGNIVNVLPIKSVVHVIGAYRGWYRIKDGWIMAKYTEIIL